jgi:arsenate reductase-like glutaredoxin family protein
MSNLFKCDTCKDAQQCPECKAEQIEHEVFNSIGRPLPQPELEEIYTLYEKELEQD